MIQQIDYWLFLGMLVAIYWALPPSARTWALGLGSLGFLTTIEAETTLTMLGFTLAIYAITQRMADPRTRRVALRAAIAALLLYLGWFKYFAVARDALLGQATIGGVLIPLGISYFTFKLIHYVIESGRGTLRPHGPADLVAYVFLAPIFTAGPIERFDHFVAERETIWRRAFLVEGLTRIVHGLIKKFVIGVVIYMVIQRVTQNGGVVWLLDNLHDVTAMHAAAFLVLSYLYVYMDFSGYTDIAIGSSRLFGLKIMENFNFPILAPNIGNLWKRWHMTLANWCQSYVYLPMIGFTRNPYAAVFASFLIMGLWHAASVNWIAWGLYNAFGVAAYQTWLSISRRRKWKALQQGPLSWLGYPTTFFYFAGSFSFTTTEGVGGAWGGLWSAIRLLAKCLFVNLPA